MADYIKETFEKLILKINAEGNCQKMIGELLYSYEDDSFFMWNGKEWLPLGKDCMDGKSIGN